ncbi:unnamed protein product [Lupinus luteus]|uniref:Uncharacterized protein n=1 Tax=Lupinus luteus TaxID=3873 RepID=A0AAV1X147_LUPLU
MAVTMILGWSFDSTNTLPFDDEFLSLLNSFKQYAFKNQVFIDKVKLDSKELSELSNDDNDNSFKTLVFYATLEKCLNQAKNSQLHILTALEQFEEEKVVGSSHYVRTLPELKNFKAVGDPFSEEFFKIYNSVYNQHILMFENLQVINTEFDTKLKSIQTWRKFLRVIFAATIVVVLICSIIVVVTIDSKRVVAAIAVSSAVPIGSMGKID